ncbi:RNA polymerase sigma factor [Sporosarcina sp. ANT_H38]|uniref:RNA polymerase sigma factor n=1 Tax=Sporosarcina sp. ANT_H38 TaxID=2597358 RepID=UPI0011F144AA|nr:RNA polymerase sigma factor [Sporosarcina sp. ANT_H38]KAA0944013.1 RNA polymerase sigma factor [Sporosarcina sp. ANT_H38]
MDEMELIIKAQQGDKVAYGELMNLRYRTVEKFAYQCGVHLDDIPDVTQEVFIKLYRFLHQFKQDRFTTWLYKVTLNTARDYYRKEHREREKKAKANGTNLYPAQNSAETQILLFEEDLELHNAILKLDEKYRIPLILFYFQDLSYQQIADVLNIPLSTVKTRLHRAKDGLKKAIDKNGGASYGK